MVRRGPKLPIHRKSSIRALKVRKLLKELSMICDEKPLFDLGNEIKGLVVVYPLLAGCLPMGGLGNSCSSK
jgi:hypothetical protein